MDCEGIDVYFMQAWFLFEKAEGGGCFMEKNETSSSRGGILLKSIILPMFTVCKVLQVIISSFNWHCVYFQTTLTLYKK